MTRVAFGLLSVNELLTHVVAKGLNTIVLVGILEQKIVAFSKNYRGICTNIHDNTIIVSFWYKKKKNSQSTMDQLLITSLDSCMSEAMQNKS